MEDMSSRLLREGAWREVDRKEPAEELMSTVLRDRPEQEHTFERQQHCGS